MCGGTAWGSAVTAVLKDCRLRSMDTFGVLGALLSALLGSVPVWWWAHGAAASALLGLIYYYLLKPLDWTKDLCDVGFEPRASRRSRSAVLREAQRRRRIGNLPPVYPNGWFAVLESSRLPCAGVEHVAALGQNLAVFRGETGTVHVLDAYCPHMGANMAEGGLVHGDCLRCPFHEWSFNGHDGKCSNVPYAQKVPDFARVKRWESMETNGYVFVWHHAEGEPPSWWPQPVASVVDGSWSFVGRNEFLVSCHIQEIPENGADVAHLNAVHGPGMMGLSALSRHLWTAQWSPGAEPHNQHSAVLQLDHEMVVLGKARLFKMSVRANQIGPGYVELFMETTFGPIVMLQSVTPVEPLLQKVVHRMYCPRFLVPYAKFVFYGECVMFERDVLVWNHKKFEDKPLLVKEDRQISRYRRWYSQFYSENSPKHSFQRETMEW
ncbi:Cholesterol 7-desaturase [Frankliniella fusca]|uniref:cholesterol 7-desaturase n=1 Tax=Frankliniella fusca TaxID=407009 RepID=A0AAE1LKI6_9NEOP|nr:Cholesterol 7-desaturase [Frankliniella fusca]